jgi:hypothetical protein
MTVINLDENERIDEIQIQGVKYLAGDIPPLLAIQILNIKTNMLSRFLRISTEKQREPIIKEYLSIKNEKVEMRYWTKNHIQSMILYINKRLHEEYESGAQL